MYRSLTLAAFVAYASAQSLSSGCVSAIAGIAGNSDAACLNIGALVPLFTADANTSIVAPINNWVTGICSSAPCSNDTIAAVVKSVTDGCSTDLSAFGFNSGLTGSITTLIQQYYPTARKVACLKDGNDNCITKSLTDLQSVLGPLTLSSLMTINTENLPVNMTCTDCTKAAYNVIKTDVPSLVSDAAPSLQSQCGASFTDGNTPSDITQSASDLSSSSNSTKPSAGARNYGAIAGLGVAGAVVASTVFTLLA
ncbi:hypothetical protein CPC08DRAFT_747823 [Agrocybe pediades]|nr:hypothetical protein CPC08DRAFT_747823 [Agrocybe pediades]